MKCHHRYNAYSVWHALCNIRKGQIWPSNILIVLSWIQSQIYIDICSAWWNTLFLKSFSFEYYFPEETFSVIAHCSKALESAACSNSPECWQIGSWRRNRSVIDFQKGQWLKMLISLCHEISMYFQTITIAVPTKNAVDRKPWGGIKKTQWRNCWSSSWYSDNFAIWRILDINPAK